MVESKRNLPLRLLRIVILAVIFVFSLLILAALSLHFPFVQKKLAEIAENQVHKKTGMPVSVEKISIALPYRLAVKNIIAPGSNKDTLLRASVISVKIDPLKLLKGEIRVLLVKIEDASARIIRDSTGADLNLHPYTTAFSGDGREKESREKQQNKFSLSIEKIQLKNLGLSYLDRSSPNQGNGIDFSDIAVTGFNAEINNTAFEGNQVNSEIEQLSFSEKSGFSVDKLSTSLIIDTEQVKIKNFALQTPHSNLQYSFLLDSDSSLQSQNNISSYQGNLNLQSSTIGITDILYFRPELPENLDVDVLAEKKIDLSGKIRGSTEKIEFNRLRASVDNTFINATGSITGADSLPTARIMLRIDSLATTEADLSLFTSGSFLPRNIDLPSGLGMSAYIEGSLNSLSASLNISSGYGDIMLNAKSSLPDSIQDKRAFSSNIRTASFDLGRLLSADTIGIIEQSAYISGSVDAGSFSGPEFILSTDIKRFELMAYTYRDLSVRGRYYDNIITAQAASRDSSLVFTASGSLDMTDSLPAYSFSLDLENADFHNLNLAATDMRTEGKLDFSLHGNKPGNLNGEARLTNIIIRMQEKQGTLDSLKAVIMNKKDSTALSLRSKPLTADYRGNVELNELPSTIKQFISRYVNISGDSVAMADSSGRFELSVQLANSSMYNEILLPDLDTLLPANIRASFNAAENDLSLNAGIPRITYNGATIDTLQIDIYTKQNGTLNYDITLEQLRAGSLATGKTLIQGHAYSDTLYAGLSIPAGEGSYKYFVNAAMTQSGNRQRLWFVQDTMILNNNKFNITENNYIELQEQYIRFNNMQLFSDDQRISIERETVNDTAGKAYLLSLSDFSLDNFSGIIEEDQELISGMISGNVSLDPSLKPVRYNAGLVFSDLLIYNDTIFNRVSLQANNDEKGIINILLRSEGKINSLTITGNIEPLKNRTALDVDLQIGNINLASLAPLLSEQLGELKGAISGGIDLGGTVNEPMLTGSLLMTDVRVLPYYLNTLLLIEDERLEINENNVLFKNFTLKDRDENYIEIDGNVNFSSFAEPSFNLDIESPEFRFLNTSYQDNDLYYGNVSAGLNAGISGTLSQPVVDIRALFSSDSEFHFVVPGLNTASADEEGVIYFTGVNDTTGQKSLVNIADSIQTGTDQSPVSLDLTANVELNPEMKIFIVIDPVSGEELSFKGDGNMSFSMKGNESPSLIGRYVIEDGTYSLALMEVIRRNFHIEEGSYLQWNGDIDNASADITASYLVRTSPMPLIQNETSELTQESARQYSSNMPFSVNLNIKGLLLSPALSFELESEQDEVDPLIRTKLSRLNQEETQLNKQVFSLLLFNSFMETSVTHPTTTAYELNATARSSVSKLLSRQINNFADRYIDFVDLDVAVSSYYQELGNPSSATTEVSVNLSREFFDEQLSLKLGGDFNVEGREYNAQQDISTFAGDVIVEYKLDRKGRYRLRGFRKTEYENLFEGEVHETGAAFIFNRDFYKLKNLFSRKDDNKKR